MRLGEFLENINEGIVLLEYEPTDHPERTFHNLLEQFSKKDITPVIVDIKDTLQVFVQQLKLQGLQVNTEKLRVIKEGGRVIIGEIIGKIDEFEDFSHHMGKYWEVYKNIPEKNRKVVIVLGLHKFLDQINPKISKIEAYFEIIGRRHLQEPGRLAVLFVNIEASSHYFLKSLEELSDYVLRIDKNQEVKIIASPGGA
ncbi:hypothetical protein A3L04_03890 [Thermococcus chitonophagus]|uniref:Uncharacterized protein n=1 Tax=Thermococcus chitonophagus TaxID=54262 RepID=A0A170SV75_9EURY|nr:DUF257 family protein [Thermococcus chitonophagus]ASJ16275.1 hypothetical protein A3L04_03890 [Thermococcus chitonophagus]CUX78739.1 hypothetical protein, conserved, DUF257 family [Thermococcus chitonophagus]